MVYIYFVPQWFFGIGITMEVLFALITLTIAFFAFKTYKIASQSQLKFFAISFSLISLSYVIWAALNFFLLSEIKDGFELQLGSLMSAAYLVNFIYMFLFIAGLITLVYATFDIKNGKIYYIMLGLALVGIASSLNKVATFRIIAIFLLTFIAFHYLYKCAEKSKANTRFVLVSFILLFISNVVFLFGSQFYYSYIFAHLLELGAYVLMLVSLFSSVKK